MGASSVVQGSEEAQGLFVTTGGLDMLLARTLQHLRYQAHSPTATASNGGSNGGQGSSSSSDDLVDGGGLSRRELAVQLLLFLQLMEQWVLAEALKAGEYTDSYSDSGSYSYSDRRSPQGGKDAQERCQKTSNKHSHRDTQVTSDHPCTW